MFRKKQIATIFGKIGCGKSTLISILQQFYTFESGEICVNDPNWKSPSIPAWRKPIALVTQQVSLFNGTILENICVEENSNVQEAISFCRETCLDAFINESNRVMPP